MIGWFYATVNCSKLFISMIHLYYHYYIARYIFSFLSFSRNIISLIISFTNFIVQNIYYLFCYCWIFFCENLDHYGIIPSSHRQPLHPSKLRSQDRFTTTTAYRDHKFEGRLCTKVSKRGERAPRKEISKIGYRSTYLSRRSFKMRRVGI